MSRASKWLAALLTIGLAVLALVGCGGTGGSAPTNPGTGQSGVQLSIRWPEQTRLIPRLTQSVRVQLVPTKPEGAAPLHDVVVNRPEGQRESVVQFKDLPSVEVNLKVWAHPSPGAEGVPLAYAEKTIQIREGHYDQHGITLDSTIERVEVKAPNVRPKIDETVELSVEAYDAEGRIVLTPDNGWVFTLEDERTAKLDVTDESVKLTPILAGPIRVYAQEKESAVEGEITLNGQAVVVVQPRTGQVDPGGELQFTAEVKGLDDQAVRWTAEGGAITVDGKYLAGSAPGTYTVTATSTADANVRGTATVAITGSDAIEGWWLADVEGYPTVKRLMKVQRQGSLIAWNNYRYDRVPTTPPDPNQMAVFWNRITDTEFDVWRQYNATVFRLHGTFDNGVMRGTYSVLYPNDPDWRVLDTFVGVRHTFPGGS